MNSDRQDQPPFLGIVLDIDENLMIVQATKQHNPRKNLSQSAEQDLSQSWEGVVPRPQLVGTEKAHIATAHRRKDWKDFLEKVSSINERYKTAHPEDKRMLINVFSTYQFKL